MSKENLNQRSKKRRSLKTLYLTPSINRKYAPGGQLFKDWNSKSSDAWKNSFSNGNGFSSTMSLVGGASSVIDAGLKNAEIADTTGLETSMQKAGTDIGASDLDTLLESWTSMPVWDNSLEWKDVRGLSAGDIIGNTLGAVSSGASTGASVGGPWGAVGGGIIGGLTSLIGAGIGRGKAENKAAELNKMAEEANLRQALNMGAKAQSITDATNLVNMATIAANGGKIHIKPSKRGTFTAAAKKRGMGVQEFASNILANKENYSPAMVKKANFARNFGGRKNAGGGFLPNWDDTEIGLKAMGGNLSTHEGKFSNGISKTSNTEYLQGETYDITEEEAKILKELGYEFEYV